MLPQKIQVLFDLIDYLDENKKEYIEKYIPLCGELENLNRQRHELKPDINYIDKQSYDIIQNQIKEKFSPILSNVYTPISAKLKELGIWSGDETYASIWNNNISEISDFKRGFASEDVLQVMTYKHKYLAFRAETKSDFLCLSMAFQGLDEILKSLFDFFKDTTANEFKSFEALNIKVDSLEDAIKRFKENRGKNVKFSFPAQNLYKGLSETQPPKHHTNIKNEIFMGHKVVVGDITNNSGQIIIGNDIKISDAINSRKETADKIEELIQLIRQEPNIEDQQRQSLITNFDKVKEEISEEKPAKSKIFKWLSNTKNILENLVLTHHVTEAVHWVYENLNFISHQIRG
ncbi:hypothetical protein ACFGVS_07525 [Mucilaginibacter sp. AW1-7]|uniref:hypothetical protein n=1 Tax=Mucilaginibacter sp. AW1-7 TaxID=3349874 RepID=UPI003F7384CD